ncbi:hypothetical protein AYL99_04611 [Fonsecaea erecta]|uniref:Uncharacterized protein n=1 Tax=Fonsecaea erecta TaxID=1367422 RepID=A0A178ZRE1_9EURO|nr:hypothetical protein AYL99_04611 [Fonsecaea erecta]OAP62408.1 hypothetical protein AYL99_04611 [Fonsecaea erecta]
MDEEPLPLASKPWGQSLSMVAREASQALLKPLNGCVVEQDYHLSMQRAGQGIEELVEALFELLTNPEANGIIQFIVRTNIRVLRGLQGVCNDECKYLKRRALDIIHMDSVCHGDQNKGHIRELVEEVCRANEEQESWIDILGIEIDLSETALKRLDIASQAAGLIQKRRSQMITKEESQTLEALFIEFQSLRTLLIRRVLKLNMLTGNSDFLQRHHNELWDIVDCNLEG